MINIEKIREIYHGQSMQFPLIGAVIEGNTEGKIFCNDFENPSHIFIENKFGFCQELFTNWDSNFFEEVIKSYIQSSERTKLRLYNPERKLLEYVEKLDFASRAKREHYIYDDPNNEFQDYTTVKIVPMCLETFTDTFQLDLERRYYKNKKEFCEKAIPIIAYCGNEYVGIIYSAADDKRRCEVDIFVKQEYRNKGIAVVLINEFIKECSKKNLQVNWDCYSDNVSSNRVAQKVGFKKILEYPFFNIEVGRN